jgi:hypothetical protein
LARQQPRGLGVSPVFEGRYQNPDGTYTLSFGFQNRNTEEALTIPVGTNNKVEPGPLDQGRPTYFEPRRSYGVFAVTVPANFSRDARVTWTLEVKWRAVCDSGWPARRVRDGQPARSRNGPVSAGGGARKRR